MGSAMPSAMPGSNAALVPPSAGGGGGDTRRPNPNPVHKPTANPLEEPRDHAKLQADAQAKLARMKAQAKDGEKLPQIAQGGPSRQPQPPAQSQPHREPHRHRVAPGASGQQGVRLPQVPGAQPRAPPTPQQHQQQPHRARYYDHNPRPPPSREIRMVYHQPNGNSRVSIFQRRPPSQGSYYNPITHQAMGSQYAAGSRYRGQAQGIPYSNAPRVDPYSAQRRRIGNNWY